jgi:2-oxoglutarate ferredoxin oxidoreductase subunit beta
MIAATYKRYLREARLPSIWCPGCGNGIIVKALLQATTALGLNNDEVVVVGGIGCSGRTPFLLDFNTMHTTHGRALAFATGIKMMRPDWHVIVIMGDGDAAAIGGNHFIHACRRNIDLTALIFNNAIYGQTGGQLAPTTPQGKRSATSLEGNIEPPFDMVQLALGAGASFVARTTVFDFQEMTMLIQKALLHKGFSVIEIMTTCPTYFGRLNDLREPYDSLHYLKEITIPLSELEMEAGDPTPQLPTGIFREELRSEYTMLYRHLCEQLRQSAGRGKESATHAPDGEPLEALPDEETAAPLLKDPLEIRLSGAGGQGLITAGIILADAAMRSGKHVVQTQSYGPEARLGASKAELIISSHKIACPQVTHPDILVCLSQDAYDRYFRLGTSQGDAPAAPTRPGGPQKKPSLDRVVLLDATNIEFEATVGRSEVYALPITETAVQLGNKQVANVVALGALNALTHLVPWRCLQQAIQQRVPARFRQLNEQALLAGRQLIEKLSALH